MCVFCYEDSLQGAKTFQQNEPDLKWSVQVGTVAGVFVRFLNIQHDHYIYKAVLNILVRR